MLALNVSKMLVILLTLHKSKVQAKNVDCFANFRLVVIFTDFQQVFYYYYCYYYISDYYYHYYLFLLLVIILLMLFLLLL